MEFEELQARVMRSSDSPLFARLASLYIEQEDIERAKDLCLNGIKQYPSYTAGYVLLAECYAADSEMEQAKETLKQARKLFPESAVLVELQRKWEQQAQGSQPESIEQDAEKPIQQETADGEIVSQTLAEIYVQQGLLDQAIQAYRQLILKKPGQSREFEKRIQQLEKKMKEKK